MACRAALSVLAIAPGLDPHRFGDAVEGVLDQLPVIDRIAAYEAFRRGHVPDTGALELLVERGAVDPGPLRLTPLGHWALDALAEPVAPAAAWEEDEILQLRIDLDRFRPSVWRRVLVPAGTALAQLHQIVQILLEWDDDHLHVFDVDGLRYADPCHALDRVPSSRGTARVSAAQPDEGSRRPE